MTSISFISIRSFLPVTSILAALLILAPSSTAQGPGAQMDAETATPLPGSGHDCENLLSETVDPSTGQVSFRFDQPVPPSWLCRVYVYKQQ
jgi:hypothetical protein